MVIEFWADVVCPYCYIAGARLEQGVAAAGLAEVVELQHRAFELDPRASPTPGAGRAAAARRYGMSEAQLMGTERKLQAQAAAEDLPYTIERPFGNTFDIHRVLLHSDGLGLRDSLTKRLLRAHFSGERSVFEEASLVELAEAVGLDGDAVRALLRGDACADDVRREESRAQERGVHVVPYIAAAEDLAAVGAQPTDAYSDLVTRASGRGL